MKYYCWCVKYFILSCIFCLSSCRQEYVERIYYPSGQIKEELIFPTKEDQQTRQNCKNITYYENGKIHLLRTIKDGLTNGACFVWYENGLLDKFIMYKNDTLHGIHKEFSPTGHLTREAFFLMGV